MTTGTITNMNIGKDITLEKVGGVGGIACLKGFKMSASFTDVTMTTGFAGSGLLVSIEHALLNGAMNSCSVSATRTTISGFY